MQVLIGEHNLLPNNYLGEREKLTQAKNLIEEVVKDFTKNSVTLGFKAVDRCYFCGKPVVEGSEYCKEHKEYMEERQCQR